jgi:MarR family transcriptional regulator, transcriptional regulator for hemolysin
MDFVDPYESIGFHCSLTYRAFARALENRLHKSGIKPAQFFALSHLMALGDMPQGELAGYLSTSAVSVVKLIDRMERDGWVVRKQSTEDRRVKNVSLTEKAKAVWKELTVHARSVIEQAHGGISEEEIERTKNILSKIRKNLEIQGE